MTIRGHPGNHAVLLGVASGARPVVGLYGATMVTVVNIDTRNKALEQATIATKPRDETDTCDDTQPPGLAHRTGNCHLNRV